MEFTQCIEIDKSIRMF